MCGILFALDAAASSPQPTWDCYSAAIAARGPDSLQQVSKAIHIPQSATPLQLRFLSSVLALRGDHVGVQPLVESNKEGAKGNVLCWNGQIFAGVSVALSENDTEVLFRTLSERISEHRPDASKSEVNVDQVVVDVFASIEGPYAFVYYDAPSQTLYFARDVFGRRSLLMPFTGSQPDPVNATDNHIVHASASLPPFVLSSVRPGLRNDDRADSPMQEVDCRWIWALSLQHMEVTAAGINWAPALRQLPRSPSSNASRDFARIPTLNGILPAEPLPTTGPGYPHTKQVYVDQFVYSLSESVRLRVCNIPPPKVKGEARLAILFSGGVDCAFITHLAHHFLPLDEPIDLLNVAFENPRTIASAKLERQKAAERAMKIQKMNKRSKGTQQPRAILPLEPVATDGIISSLDSSNSEPPIDETQDIYDVPDRITGRETVAELRKIHPERDWRFVEINITYQECQSAKPTVLDLMYPSDTEMDLSLALPLWFAARRNGYLQNSKCGSMQEYTSAAKVLMSGLGADELLGGYARHRRAFETNSWQGTIDEMQLDLDRLPFRNLGRDDRIISSHGVETRFPYLSLSFATAIAQLPIDAKCDFRYEEGVGDKSLIRIAAHQIGLVGAASKKKRAMQFGTRSARMEPEAKGTKQRGMGQHKVLLRQ